MAHSVANHGLDLGLAVAQLRESRRYGAIDDLEVATAGQLLELHQSKIGFDAGGIAIHHQADCTSRRNDGYLSIAEAVLLAECQGAIPACPSGSRERLIGAVGMIECNRQDRQPLIAGFLAVGGAPVVANDP